MSTTTKKFVLPAAFLATLLIGVGVGASGEGEATSAAPAPTVTATVKATVTATPAPAPTVTVNASRTNPDCLAMIDASIEILEINKDMADLVATHLTNDQLGFRAVAEMDIAGIDSYTEEMYIFNDGVKALTARMDDVQLAEYTGKCVG